MSKNNLCYSCPKKDECNRSIITSFNILQENIYKQIHYKYTTLLDIRIAENEYFQEVYYAAFFYLIRGLVFSDGERKSCLEFLREKYPLEPLDTGELANNAVYQSRLRYIKRVARLHNKPFKYYWIMNRHEFELMEFVLRYRKNRHFRDNDSANKILKYDRGFKMDIFSKMYEYSMPSGHKITLSDLQNDFEMINQIYNDIENESQSYFEKCVKYNIVEYKLHYETAYKFVYELNKNYKDMSDEDKNKALQYEAVLRHIKVRYNGKIRLVEFPIFANMSQWINFFFYVFRITKRRPIECANILFDITNAMLESIDICMADKQHLLLDFCITECKFAENIFENYLGKGQHIVRNKVLDKKTVKDLKTIFDKSEYIE